MASQIPGRRLARNLRKTENIVPNARDDSSLGVGSRNERIFSRAKSDSKLALPSHGAATQPAKSTLLAPTASSKAKVVGVPDAKGEKRKREALVERSERNRTLSNPATAAISKPPKPVIALNRKTAHKSLHSIHHAPIHNQKDKITRAVLESIQDAPHHAADYDKMQVSDEPMPFVPLAPVKESEVGTYDDEEQGLEQPAAKRQHTLSPQPPTAPEDTESGQEVEEVARDLDPLFEEQLEKEELWDDLDAADWDDPCMVSEYVVEIHEYLKGVESEVLPDSRYVDSQPEISWSQRRELLDWLYSVHHTFRLQNESWFLTVNVLDRFLSKRQIGANKLQLVALVCLFISCKFEETYVPAIHQMVAWLCSDDELKKVDAIKKKMGTFMIAERYILQTLGWDLKYPSPLGWLRRGSKADDLDDRVRLVGKYLMDLASMDWRNVGIRPSLLAASALWVSRLIFRKAEWTPNLVHYTSYTEEDMMTPAKLMIDALLRPKGHYPAVFAKYACKKLGKASLFCRTWALTRWPAETRVNLHEDLPLIKDEIYTTLEEKAQKLAATKPAEEEQQQ